MNTERRSRNRSSADWQSAVSPAGSRQRGEGFGAREQGAASAGCQPATQQAASLRYREALRAGTARAPKSSRCARISPGELATIRPPEHGRRRRAFGPGGTPQEISRGQVRASGRRPRKPSREARCPSGASEKFLASAVPQRLRHRSSPRTGRAARDRPPSRAISSMPRWGTEPRGTDSGGGVRWRGLAPG